MPYSSNIDPILDKNTERIRKKNIDSTRREKRIKAKRYGSSRVSTSGLSWSTWSAVVSRSLDDDHEVQRSPPRWASLFVLFLSAGPPDRVELIGAGSLGQLSATGPAPASAEG